MGNGVSLVAQERINTAKRQRLLELNLSNCFLREIPPSSLSSFFSTPISVELQKLNLEKNNLSRISPKLFLTYTCLQYLNLSYNDFQILPDELNVLVSLRELNIAGNQLREIPASWRTFSSLQRLNIGANLIQDIPLSFLGAFTRTLEEFDYSFNRLQSPPNSIFSLTQLRILKLSHNELTTVSNAFAAFQDTLEVLDLSENRLTNISDLKALTNLVSLSIGSNAIKILPEELFIHLTKLETLNLRCNRLESISESLGKLEKLTELNCENNKLSRLPDSIGQLRNLRFLNVMNNMLIELPHQLGYCYESLRKLLAKNNQLTALPGEFSYLSESFHLDINNNPLKAPFSVWWQENTSTILQKLVPYMRAYPANCVVATLSDNSLRAKVSCGNSFSIEAYDYKGSKRISGGEIFTVFAERDQNREDFIVKDNKDGTYFAFYNLLQAGVYSISVIVYGQHISNSPFSLVVE